MKVALVAESFLPHMNGVTRSLLQVIEQLAARGDEVLVIAAHSSEVPHRHAGFDVLGVPSFALPRYRRVRVVVTSTRRIRKLLADFAPDVVHLASPILLGWWAVAAASSLHLPTVAVYQTDVPSYAGRYGFPGSEAIVWAHLRRLHQKATLNLAPSSAASADLDRHGVRDIRRWGRGVDAELFQPAKRADTLRESWGAGAGSGRTVVGYVGRLAAEKQVEDLRVLAELSDVQVVIVGDGPLRGRLQKLIPDAVFTGFLEGEALAHAYASFDVFVHPGESETFCQTVQEALASGVPVVATGRGGPLDLVDHSRTGWLYRPGDLDDLKGRVQDLVGDAFKRRAFALTARATVEQRSWPAVCEQLFAYYDEAISINRAQRVAAAGSRPGGSRLAESRLDGSRLAESRLGESREQAQERGPAHAKGRSGAVGDANGASGARRTARQTVGGVPSP